MSTNLQVYHLAPTVQRFAVSDFVGLKDVERP
jgi:hypothetical protein